MATTFRIGQNPNNDLTGRQMTFDMQNLTATVLSTAYQFLPYLGDATYVLNLTGNVSLTVGVGTSTTPPYVGDKLRLVCLPDSSTRTLTFSTGFLVTASTLAVTGSKTATIDFVFNGAAWQEVTRSITV